MWQITSPLFNGRVRNFTTQTAALAFVQRKTQRMADHRHTADELRQQITVTEIPTLDIGTEGEYPSNALSNVAPHIFVMDGIACDSMEGFLQSLKTDNQAEQINICQKVGFDAKHSGHVYNSQWKQTQTLHWNGIAYPRLSHE